MTSQRWRYDIEPPAILSFHFVLISKLWASSRASAHPKRFHLKSYLSPEIMMCRGIVRGSVRTVPKTPGNLQSHGFCHSLSRRIFSTQSPAMSYGHGCVLRSRKWEKNMEYRTIRQSNGASFSTRATDRWAAAVAVDLAEWHFICLWFRPVEPNRTRALIH